MYPPTHSCPHTPVHDGARLGMHLVHLPAETGVETQTVVSPHLYGQCTLGAVLHELLIHLNQEVLHTHTHTACQSGITHTVASRISFTGRLLKYELCSAA